MKRISTLFAAALCLAALAPAKADYLSMDMFGYTNKLMVAGYTGTETLTNFPVLVRLSESGIPGFHYDDMSAKNQGKATGKDLAFFDELGNHLASEIQTNDWTTSGESLVWVSLPRMQQGTKFYMCYNTEASGVWVTNQNPWTDYVGVWHLDESGGQNKPIFDSTTNRLNGKVVNSGDSVFRVSEGAIGAARRIAGDNGHGPGIIVAATNGWQKTAADSLGTDFHASFWMSPQGDKTTNRKWSNLLGRRKGDKGESWGVSIDDDAKGLRLYADGTQTTKNDQQRFVSTYRDTGHGLTTTAVPPTIPNQFPFLDTRGGWYKIDILWKYKTAGDVACYEVYSNAVLAAAGALIGPVSDVPANIGIGCSTQDAYGSSPAEKKGRRFWGDMDEVRLRPGIVSADWIKADFDTAMNSAFVILAPPEVLEVAWAEDSGRSGVTNVAWNAAAVGGVVTGLGPNATEGAIEGKFWADGETEPAVWTTLTNGLDRLDAFEVVVSCVENTTYHYKLRAVDDGNSETDPVSGSFTTPLGLAVTWATVPGRAGVTNVLGHSVVVGGSVGCLGDSATVSVEGKFWKNGQEEPATWTALVANLSQTGDFSASVMGLEVDTVYSFKLRVAGSNGNATEPVSGTITTSHGLTISWAGTAEQPGVTNVAWNAAVVGGIVEALGDVASCTVEGKFWADGAAEPSEWSSLRAGVGGGSFSIQIPNLAENTTYRYKLRATETDGSETPAASGSFTTPVGLAAVWADDVAGRPGVTAVGVFSATVGGSVECLGDSATCTVEGKFWTGETEPADWTTLGGSLSQTGAFTATAPNLAGGAAYSYKLRLAGSNGVATEPVSGTFTTDPSLTVAWSTATASTGIASLGYGFVAVGGQVTALGEATVCSVQSKIWIAGETEPDEWTTLKDRLGLNGTFSVNVPGLKAGTTYRYELRAVGDDGEATVPVSSSFTTPGESGEEIGSEWTHFFDDGTNAVWVANDFERYLPFTVTGYRGGETLTNFPVLVEVRSKDTNGFSYDDFYHYDGADIVFVDEKGHIIPHEIDTWNKNGMSLFWVRLPEMKNGTTFTMCYRSPLLKTPPDPGNTFERYVGVWHMSEKGDGVVNLKDSTVNDFETETHAQSLYENNGRIGGARRVAQTPGSAASYGRIIAFDHDDILRTGVGNVFTYSGWYKLKDQPPKWAYLVSRKSEDADRGWGVQYQENSTAELRVWSGSKAKDGFNGQTFKFSNTGTAWHYWTFVFDGNGPFGPGTNGLFYAYLDGQKVTSIANGLPLKYDIANDETADYDNLCVVGQQNGTGAFNGFVDEARYSKGTRSADWIRAEYDSTKNPQQNTFVTKGTVSRGADSLVPVVVWERGADLPDTIIDVSYAYVQFAGTVTYCGSGATNCWVEYQLWVDGESQPETWTTLASDLRAGQYFSIPVTGLKQDMLYNFRIRAVALVDEELRQNHEHSGQFRTNGNLELGTVDGELFRLGDKFVHRYRAGAWTFTTPDYVTNVEILVVGGGGAGGYKVGGGGGGGGLFHSASYPVTTSTVYRINVGEGGTAPSDVSTHSEIGNGQHSYFALASDEAHPLIFVPGGGGGGSYANDADVATGADGASGGGGTYAKFGGTATEDGVYGHDGGRGNDFLKGGSIGKVAAGGGGGAGRVGLGATFDSWSTGGSGGVGVANSMTGETLFYGAGGGGGYIYRMETAQDGTDNFSKPGGGGSGIGGNAADVRNGTPATSGVENTGAGGGGGSSKGSGKGDVVDESDSTYWQGGDGGDGVVLISYEAHGRDPVSEEPRITMTRCDYISKEMVANINYRAYWAGIQAQTNDVYVLYSTVSEADVAAGNGEMVKVATDTIGIGSTSFEPPAVGFTYWVRLVARKTANSFMYSDEIASFEVPAVEVNGTDPKMPDENDASKDSAEISYNLFDTASDARLYCYWSENRSDLEGDAAPTGSTVHFLDLGTGRAGEGKKFTIYAADGIERNKVYYVRLATGNEAGTKYFLSKQIVLLEMIDKPRVIFDEGVWNNHKATVDFHLTTATLDPATVDLVALYSGIEADVKADPAKNDLLHKTGVVVVNLGLCSQYPDDVNTSTQFPMWSPADTNFYVRLALTTNNITVTDGVAVTNVVPVCYSQSYHTLTAITAVPANTLLIYANADAQIGCYGDEPKPLTYAVSYGGRTEGPGWDNWQRVGGLTGALASDVSALSPTGQYDIVQGSLLLNNGGQPFVNNEPVIDPETGNPVVDPDTGETALTPVTYSYLLVFTGSKYTVTNAQFTVSVADASTRYTGEPFDDLNLVVTTNGLRNAQPITFLYRVGTNDWTSTIETTYSDIWTHIIQFKASAPNHDDARGTFMITIEPTPLRAEISAAELNYTGAAQVPAITTNVFGHMRPDLNPLTSEFREEAGEWQSVVPAFTQPGTYKLFYRVSAANHVPYTTNCTFKVVGWDYWVNLDGQTGYQTPIFVTDPAWFLKATGLTSEQFADRDTRLAELDEVQDNGLKLWQNYVIEREDLTKKLVAAVVQSGSRVNAGSFVVHFPGVDALRNTGLDVNYRLDRKLKGETEFTQGALSDKYEMNVPLGPGDPTGLYVFNIVLTPTNPLTGQAVLASCATVGVLRVSSLATNTVTAVPWMAMSKDEAANKPVTVAEAVNPNGLAEGTRDGDGDRILVYNAAADEFLSWSHLAGTSWSAATTVKKSGLTSSDADTTTLARGTAFWLVRNDPGSVGSTNHVYLVGRYTGGSYTNALAGGTADEPGYTLVANPTMDDVDLNDDLAFVGGSGNTATPADTDRIVIQDVSGIDKVYVRKDGVWGRYVSRKVNGRIKQTWESGGTVPSGTGFWYVRTAEGALSIRFGGEE